MFGTVVDSLSGSPVSGARVVVADLGLEARTRGDGTFRMTGVTGGVHTITIQQIGFAPWNRTFQLNVVEPIRVDVGTVLLGPADVQTLDPIVVEGEEYRGSIVMGPFYQRMRTANGTFLTGEDIERADPRTMSDLLRRVGALNVGRDSRITSVRGTSSMRNWSQECEMDYFIDGVRVTSSSIDVIVPTTLAGVEVYSGGPNIPAVFRRFGRRPQCGIIAMWTKDGGPR